MAITASMVKELREKTSAGMLDCKKALEECSGDFEAAVDWLRKKGLSAAAKKADRLASEGLVQIFRSQDNKTGVVVEVNSETDFVARNEAFKTLVADLAEQVAGLSEQGIVEPATPVLSQAYFKNSALKVEDYLKQQIATIGENLVFRRYARLAADANSLIQTYLHGDGKIGVLLKLSVGSNTLVENPEVKTLANDICLHIAAMNPMAISEIEIPQEARLREKEVLLGKAAEQGKKPEMIEKIVEGQIRKWLAENCLLDQTFVKNPDLTIKKLIDDTQKKLGGSCQLKIEQFVRFELGAGLQKKSENFAEEVAAQMKTH